MVSGQVEHEQSQSRFVYKASESQEAAFLKYEKQEDGTLDLRHTYTPPSLRGQGIAERLTKAAFDYAEQQGVKVIPTCPYISDKYLVKHPDKRQFSKM